MCTIMLSVFIITIEQTAVHCNKLQSLSAIMLLVFITHYMHTYMLVRLYMYTYIYTHCNTLQHIVTHCSTLQYNATYWNTLQQTGDDTKHQGSEYVGSISIQTINVFELAGPSPCPVYQLNLSTARDTPCFLHGGGVWPCFVWGPN